MEGLQPVAMQKSNDSTRHSRLLRRATYASVATATLLITGKLAAWVMTGSVSVLASLVDSMMDVAASLINLFAVRYALMPADHEHRFGHGKAESLSTGCCIRGRSRMWGSGWGSWCSRSWRRWCC